MNELYLLGFLLTARRDDAEQCFVSALADCLGATSVVKECARSWSKREIIKNAIRIVTPAANHEDKTCEAETTAEGFVPKQLEVITQLKPFLRFAFVMSILEGYRDLECAALLACTPREVIEARCRATYQLGTLKASNPEIICEAVASQQKRPIMETVQIEEGRLAFGLGGTADETRCS